MLSPNTQAVSTRSFRASVDPAGGPSTKTTSRSTDAADRCRSCGAMTWSVNWDVTNGNRFASTVGPHLDALP
ncbi:hypothetical protein [Micromonospora sp. LH3U1]|uniref:hypothetical protein n=1 Tax=Micromonospora sp. LH3U1 TaxID=3018339 RepID=UPI00234B59B2|nr:hypothetical protein [Micromonospora sp. LH3U1]WCN84852.1 hypothetical protein PCA76_12835 [Micromonospora sp. LH3U1]